MNNNNPDERLRLLDLELSELAAVEFAESLKKETAFRKAIENAIPGGIAVINDRGRQIYVNKSFCRMVGYKENELLGKQPPYLYWAPEDTENIRNAFRLTLDKKAPKDGFDLLFRHKSGKTMNVKVFITPFIPEQGKTFFLANVMDITDRKTAEKELIKSHLLLKSSIESHSDTIIFSIDHEYRYLYFNSAHSKIMNYLYSSEPEIGTSILELITREDDRELAKKNFDIALSGEPASLEQTFGGNNTAFFECFFNPVRNDNNDVIACTALVRDITERKHQENACRESEAKFREIINQINDGIIVCDRQGKIIIWNRGAEKIYGIRAEEALGKDMVDIQYEITPAKLKNRELIENGINGFLTMQTAERFNKIIDVEIIPANSRNTKYVQSVVFPIELEGYFLFCTVIRDTTELKKYEKELLRVSSDKDKFYSLIAQYLYNPFNLFHDFTRTIVEDIDSLSVREIQKMTVAMSKSATNLYSLLDNLMQWTKMHQDKISFEPGEHEFMKISSDAVSILKPSIEAREITVNHSAEDGLKVFADNYMLKTILRNLVTNILKYVRKGGEIVISARQLDTSVMIIISDDGSEDQPSYLGKLFNGSEIHTSLSMTDEKGAALGLLLCREFVRKHGGRIWFEPVGERGGEFRITLPHNH